MSLKLKCSYDLCIYFEETTNFYFWLKKTNKLSAKLQKLMTICSKNLYYTQKLQKHVYDKGITSKIYTLSNKIWMNSKYLKTK